MESVFDSAKPKRGGRLRGIFRWVIGLVTVSGEVKERRIGRDPGIAPECEWKISSSEAL
jgi:hypothetical protein